MCSSLCCSIVSTWLKPLWFYDPVVNFFVVVEALLITARVTLGSQFVQNWHIWLKAHMWRKRGFALPLLPVPSRSRGAFTGEGADSSVGGGGWVGKGGRVCIRIPWSEKYCILPVTYCPLPKSQIFIFKRSLKIFGVSFFLWYFSWSFLPDNISFFIFAF